MLRSAPTPAVLAARLSAAFGLALAAATPAHAITNGDFESALFGWAVLGDSLAMSHPDMPAPSGSSFLALSTASLQYEDDFPEIAGYYNFSGQAAHDNFDGSLDTFIGAAPGALGLDAFEGSAARQTITVQAGDTLHFSWNLLSVDTAMPDQAFFAIDGQVALLATAPSATDASLGAIRQTGWASASYTFTTSGEVSVAFGIVDHGDYNGTSGLLVDNVRVTAVPEPATVGLLLAGLGVLGLARSRRRA